MEQTRDVRSNLAGASGVALIAMLLMQQVRAAPPADENQQPSETPPLTLPQTRAVIEEIGRAGDVMADELMDLLDLLVLGAPGSPTPEDGVATSYMDSVEQIGCTLDPYAFRSPPLGGVVSNRFQIEALGTVSDGWLQNVETGERVALTWSPSDRGSVSTAPALRSGTWVVGVRRPSGRPLCTIVEQAPIYRIACESGPTDTRGCQALSLIHDRRYIELQMLGQQLRADDFEARDIIALAACRQGREPAILLPDDARTCAEVREEVRQPRRRIALVVGVGRYPALTGLTSLKHAEAGAHALARTLIESGSFAPEDVVLMTSDSPDPALVPTMANLSNQLRKLEDEQGVDLVVMYFSGYMSALGSGPDRENYLLLEDFDPDLYSQSAIGVGDVVASAEATGAKSRVLIFDTSRTAGVRQGADPDLVWDRLTYETSADTRILFGAAFGAPSEEDPESGQGVFTTHLLEALQGDADGYGGSGPMDGFVSVGEAYAYVLDGLTKPSATHPPQLAYLAGVTAGPDVALVAAPLDVGSLRCPIGAKSLKDVVANALATCAEPSMTQIKAANSVNIALSCLNEPLTPELSAGLLYVAAMQARATGRFERAGEASGAAATVVRDHMLVDPRPAVCRDENGGDLPSALPSPPDLLSVRLPSELLRSELTVNGTRVEGVEQELPALFQFQSRYGPYPSPLVVWGPDELPTPPPPLLLSQVRESRLVMGAVGSFALSAGMVTSALVVDHRAGALNDSINSGALSDGEAYESRARLYRLRQVENVLWTTGGLAGGATLGLGVAAIVVRY